MSLLAARHDVERTLGWVRAGTELLLARVDAVGDADLTAPSRLPGWDRRHVLAHLARNAEALNRLVSWARTGTVTPMYADADQRASEIESSAGEPPARLRQELVSTAVALDADASSLDEAAWAATVRSARGRDIRAAEVPWMRAREVWLHAVDLDLGVEPDQLPADFSLVLIDDLVTYFAGVPDITPFALVAGDQRWTVGEGEGQLVTGAPSAVAAWLTGRSQGLSLQAGTLPVLPAWI